MKNEVCCDTDVIVRFLTHRGAQPSALRVLVSQAVCVTSVLQATELLAAAEGDAELSAAESVFYAVRVLGFHSRYSAEFGRMHRIAGKVTRMRDAMTAGFCRANALHLATCRPDAFRSYPGLSLIDANTVRDGMTWQDIEATCASQTGSGHDRRMTTAATSPGGTLT